MARMPKASAMPKSVAQLTISCESGASFFDSMLRSLLAASVWALLIWGEVIGLADRSIQPCRLFW